MGIYEKILKAKLVGRGGGSYSTALKWKAVKDVVAKKKYVVCNAAEGEPGILKDGFLLEKYPDQVIEGIRFAMDYVGADEAVIFINEKYYKKLHKKIRPFFADAKIDFCIKRHDYGYIAGEESALLNAIEGKRLEPRLRPPFPTEVGLYGCPTLINNVETFYNVSKVHRGEFKHERIYSITGDVDHSGAISLPDDWSIEKILKETKNYPKFPFFVQIGGDASGIVYSESLLKNIVCGAGSIRVLKMSKHRPEKILKEWVGYFAKESCGQCTTCREGTYRLLEMINSGAIDWENFVSVLDDLECNSFCGLGTAVPVPLKSYIRNVMPTALAHEGKFRGTDLKVIQNYFK